jgi:hypothetical protein
MATALFEFLNKHLCLIFSLNVYDNWKVFRAEVLQILEFEFYCICLLILMIAFIYDFTKLILSQCTR